jgi:hypothetical protein
MATRRQVPYSALAAIIIATAWRGIMGIRRVAYGLLAALPMGAAQSHHSPAQFDLDKLTELQGTVLKLQWTNPHVFIQLMAPDAAGNAVEWSIEGPNPGGLARVGWNSKSLKPGEKIAITMNPLRAGGPAGFFLAIHKADGKLLGQTDVALMRLKNAAAAAQSQPAR